MKTLFLPLLLVLVLAGCATKTPVPVPPPINKDWTITATFNFDFTNFNACSANVPTGCITGFTWGYLNGATQVPLHTAPVTICAGTNQPQACNDVAQSKLPIGGVTFYASANFIDNKGVSGTSNAITTASPTTISADGVSNFQVGVK